MRYINGFNITKESYNSYEVPQDIEDTKMRTYLLGSNNYCSAKKGFDQNLFLLK